MDNEKKQMIKHFAEAVLTLESLEECDRFFADLCSETELNMIARRIFIAKMIVDGKTYRDILKITNTSNPTISRLKTTLSKEHSVLSDVLKRI